MKQVLPITEDHIWKDHKKEDQPEKEMFFIKRAVNHFLLRF